MKNLGIMRGWLVLLLVGFSMLLAAQPMQAVPGVATTPVQQGNLPVGPAVAGEGLATIFRPACSGGIGVAFDGTNVLYTCGGQTKVFMTDLASTNLGSIDTKDSNGNPIELDAIAWDPVENKLWGGSLGGGKCNIYSADMSSGLTTFRFSFNDPTDDLTGDFDRCGVTVTYFDGITVDTKTNTLYLSGDISEFISHVDKTGAVLGAPIPFTTLTARLCPWAARFRYTGCLNSGLTIGLDGNLFAGTANDGKIMQINPTVPSLLGQFATVTGRDEDLECGPLFTKTDGTIVETILSADFNTPKIDVLEAPKGTCVSPTVVKGSISGMKFNDLNNDGFNNAEPGLPGWTITLTSGTGTMTTTTAADGSYSFTDLTAGTYTVAETLKPGWIQTMPSTGTYTVTITSGSVIKGQDFGNFHKGKITGGGWITITGDPKATFGIVGQYPDSKSAAQGNVEYQDHIAKLNIKSIQINTVATTLDKKKGVITGLAQVNGVGSYPFEVYVEDNGEPGKGVDVFQISLPTYPYSNGAILTGGNIQIHS